MENPIPEKSLSTSVITCERHKHVPFHRWIPGLEYSPSPLLNPLIDQQSVGFWGRRSWLTNKRVYRENETNHLWIRLILMRGPRLCFRISVPHPNLSWSIIGVRCLFPYRPRSVVRTLTRLRYVTHSSSHKPTFLFQSNVNFSFDTGYPTGLQSLWLLFEVLITL